METYRAYLSCKMLSEALLRADTLGSQPKMEGSRNFYLERAREEFAELAKRMAALNVSEPA